MELSHGCKTIGGMEQVSTPLCQVLQWLAVTYLDVEYFHLIEEGPCHQLKDGFLPLFYQTRGSINTKPDEAWAWGHAQTKMGVAYEKYPSP